MNDIIPIREIETSLETKTPSEITIEQTKALISIAESFKAIASFLHEGGIQTSIARITQGSIMSSIFGGLAAKDGRNSLDARTIKQNSLEVVEIIEQVFNKMNERLQDRNRDPEIKEPPE